MSVEIVKEYAETLAASIQKKSFDQLLELFADPFEVDASIMGNSYQISEKEKLAKFLGNIPAGIQISINKILDNEDGTFTAKVAMGIGFMKMPGKWSINLDDKQLIKKLIIR
ncbi:MAG: hypothetical protein KDD94_01550 [Calditrichaeota bacterium]|nr:hypothetical protein [Calditrichota bacterium]